MAKEKKKPVPKRLPRASNGNITVTVVRTIESGKRIIKESILDVLKVETYKTNDRKFEIYTQRDEKRKLLVIDAYETRYHEQHFISNLERELKIGNLQLKPKQYEGYDKAMAAMKKSIDVYAAKPLRDELWQKMLGDLLELSQRDSGWPAPIRKE